MQITDNFTNVRDKNLGNSYSNVRILRDWSCYWVLEMEL